MTQKQLLKLSDAEKCRVMIKILNQEIKYKAKGR
jgi:hypothetical protein